MKLSVVLITRDEEQNIEECLACVRWADEIIVVDGGSKDRTREIARMVTPLVFEIPFVDFAMQKNNAIRHAKGEWILVLDADERISETLAEEIQKVIADPSAKGNVYALKRNTYFFGKRLRFSGTRTDAPIRLFPNGHAHYTQPVHERIVTDLPVQKLSAPMDHFSTRDLATYRKKLHQYVDLEVELMKKFKRKVFPLDFLLRPPLKFVQLYLCQSGWLDGRSGFFYAALSSVYVFLKYWKYSLHKS